MPSKPMTCDLCGRQIDPEDTYNVFRRVTGWERMTHRRASGARGGSDIVLREKQDAYAHALCVSLARDGIQPGQEALL